MAEQITKIKPKNTGQKQIFKNPILEKLTRTHISIPIILFCGVSAALVYFGLSKQYITAWQVLLTFLIGLITFSWVEYMAHRFLFHMVTDTALKKDIQYKFHGVHHEYPKDKMRLAMPPLVSIVLCALLFGLFKLLMGNYTFGFLPGFLVGYAAYLGVHYAVHAFRPPSNFLRILWVHHGIHHYKRCDKAFGVSSPLWDYIYRTMP